MSDDDRKYGVRIGIPSGSRWLTNADIGRGRCDDARVELSKNAIGVAVALYVSSFADAGIEAPGCVVVDLSVPDLASL